jgi:hypothetical protein
MDSKAVVQRSQAEYLQVLSESERQTLIALLRRVLVADDAARVRSGHVITGLICPHEESAGRRTRPLERATASSLVKFASLQARKELVALLYP